MFSSVCVCVRVRLLLRCASGRAVLEAGGTSERGTTTRCRVRSCDRIHLTASRLISSVNFLHEQDVVLGVPEELVYEEEPAPGKQLPRATQRLGEASPVDQLAPLQVREHRRRRVSKGDKRPVPRIALRKPAGMASRPHKDALPKPGIQPVTPPMRREHHDHLVPVGEQLPPFQSPAFDSPESPCVSSARHSGSDGDGEPPLSLGSAEETPPEEIVANIHDPLRLTGVTYIPPKQLAGDENALAQAEDSYVRHVGAVRRARRVIDVRTPHGYRDYRARHPVGAQARGLDSVHTWLSGRGMSTSIAPLSTISVPKPKVRRRRDPDSDFQQQVRMVEAQMAHEPRCLAHKLMYQLSPDRPKDEPFKYVFGVPNKFTPDIDASATRIQSRYRGHKARRSTRSYREGQAACHIQARTRGRQTRRMQAEAKRDREAQLAAYEAEIFAEVWSVLTYVKDRAAAAEDEEKAQKLHIEMCKQAAGEFSQAMLNNAIEKALERREVEENKSKRSKWKVAKTSGGVGGSLGKGAGSRIRRASVTLMAALGLNKTGDRQQNEDRAQGERRSKVGKILRKASIAMNLGKREQHQHLHQARTKESEQIKNDPVLAAAAAATVDAAQKSGKKAVKELKKRVRRASIVMLAAAVGSKLNAVKAETVQQKAMELEDLKKQRQELENATMAGNEGNISSAAVVVAAASAVTSSSASPQEDSSSEEDEYDEISSPPDAELDPGARLAPKVGSQPVSSLLTSTREIASSDYHTAKTHDATPSNAKTGELQAVGIQMAAAAAAGIGSEHVAIGQTGSRVTEALSLADGSLRLFTPIGTSSSPTSAVPPAAAADDDVPPKDTTVDDSTVGSKARGALLGGLRSGELEASVSQMRDAAAYSAEIAAATAEQAAAEERRQLAMIRRAELERIASEEAAAAAQTAAEHEEFCRRAGVPLHGPGRSL